MEDEKSTRKQENEEENKYYITPISRQEKKFRGLPFK